MNHTLHSKSRMQQRGIKVGLTDMIVEHGKRSRKPGGIFEYRLTKRIRNDLIMERKREIQMLDKAIQVAVLAAEDGTIITTYHKQK